MSLFQFKVSSLSKLKNSPQNDGILTKSDSESTVTSKPSRLFKTETESPVSASVSQFFIDEDELWSDDNSDIFELRKEKGKENLPTSEQSVERKCQEVNPVEEGNKKSGDDDTDDDICDETDFDLTDHCFQIPAEKEACFDLFTDNNEFEIETEKEDINRLENSKSPVFDLSNKTVIKSNEYNFDNHRESLKTKDVLKSETNPTRNSEESKSFPFFQEKLNPLGLAQDTDVWLENILQNEAFFNISTDTPESKLQNNLSFLNKSYTEILEKVMTAFENLPIEMLKKFPEFDPDVFMTLRTTRRRIRALIIKTENLIKRKNSSQCVKDLQNMTIGEEKRQNSYFEMNAQPERDFSRFSCSSYTDLNQSLDGSSSKLANTAFVYNQPSKLLNKSESPNENLIKASPGEMQRQNMFPNINDQILMDSPISKSSPKPSTSVNSSFIDLTDVLYHTQAKESSSSTTSGRFHSNMRNDGFSGEFDGLNFPHSQKLLEMFHKKFGLRSFRPNQLQVINATLLGHDCFVLMPTGGGKSLCYQLPALVSEGVTVVISPLRSLILDQVTKLVTLDIAAAHLSGEIKDSEASCVYEKLNKPVPALKLLYVTPEKLGVSTNLRNCLTGLYKRGMLARFVIDEAHCVSQWGHDFRPDYKKLRELRENFPKVNIMALTATATPRVRTDILHQLKVVNPKWFLSSFNRSNLTYSVKEKKGKSTLKEIATLIQKDFKKDTGVIYCFSRKECEDVARDLKEYGILAIPYHAGLNDQERTRAQNLWMNDKVKVVCATIAFGMGIDKLDVRFVIHYSLPKSIEGYYQESGRAGRDGEKAICILYYSYRDKIRMLKLINMDQSVKTEAARKVHIDNLFRVVAFAENKTDCRRAIQLEYFGEKFDRKSCIENRDTACDNCLQQGIYETIDVTAESKAIVSAVKQVCGSDEQRHSNFTMLHFVDVFKGTVVKKVLSEGHNNLSMYGMGKSWQRLDVERLFRKLIMEDFLKERLMVKEDGITFAYVKFGRRGGELLNGGIKITFEVKKRKGSSSAQGISVKAEDQVDPALLAIQEKCYSELMDAIHEIASSVNCNPNAIMNVQALRSMSFTLPETEEQMLSINHVTTANFEKYGNILLEITKKYAAEKKAQGLVTEEKEEDAFVDNPWLSKTSDDSPYFETDITFCGKEGDGKKRKRSNNYRKWQYSKKWKGANGSNKGNTSKPRTSKKNSSKSNANTSGAVTIPGAKFSTLMELPTDKTRGFARPKVLLKNL